MRLYLFFPWLMKVRFAVEDETGFTVDKVNVFVDAVKV